MEYDLMMSIKGAWKSIVEMSLLLVRMSREAACYQVIVAVGGAKQDGNMMLISHFCMFIKTG